MMENNKFNVIIVGTFDCENFGDLLFPIVMQQYLTEKQVLNELFMFSPKECAMPFYPERHVYSISTMESFISCHHVDAIIIGGGDLIRLDNHIGKSYLNSNDASSLWAIPILLGKQFGIPVIFNCPGVPFEFNNGNKKFVQFILQNVDYLSVRDEYSKEYLVQAGVKNIIKVSVDSIVGIAKVYTPAFIDSVFVDLQQQLCLPKGKYVILQINNSIFTEEHKEKLKEFIQTIADNTEYNLLFMPIGYEHNDDIALRELKGTCSCNIYMPEKKLHPIEMIAIIKHASMFMGTSLHGAVISYAYGVKFMEIMAGFSTKISGFCKKINADKNIININEDLWERFLLIINKSTKFISREQILNELDNHINNVIFEIKRPQCPGAQKYLSELFDLSIDYNYELIRPKLYLDLGDGYNEEQVIYGNEIAENGYFKYRFMLLPDCRAVRFDPLEKHNCILYVNYIISDKGIVEISNSNGIKFGDGYIYNDDDPRIELKIEENTQWIEIQAYILYCNKKSAYSWDNITNEYIELFSQFNGVQDNLVRLEQNIQKQISISEMKDAEITGYINRLKKKEDEKAEYSRQIQDLINKNGENANQISSLQNEIEALRNSTCWRLTKPVRAIVIVFRKLFSPKAWGRALKKVYMSIPISISLKLKVKGVLFRVFSPFIKNTNAYKAWKNYNRGFDETIETEQQITVFEGEKADYISQIMNIPFSKNKAEFVPKNGKQISLKQGDVKYLAFYLPQYHPFPENDEWWGKGFTEWTNVTKAVPQFVGHYQPRLAGELGYYDLRNRDTIKQQMELAKLYGIYGFCMYYYWFDGKKLMDTPLNLIMENDDLDLPFCLCWANENWSRKWDGKNKDILIAQNYDEHFPVKFIESVVPYLRDRRYINVEGKPLLIIYNSNEIPHLKDTIEVWREYCRNCGIGEIHLLAVDFALNITSRGAGFDGFVEFPPHSVYHYGLETINDELKIIDKNYSGRVFDYGNIVSEKQYLKRELDKYYKGIFLGWDNTARRPKDATVFHRFRISAFREWLSDITKFTIEHHNENDRYIFINAWNEWAEGTYLEPDGRYGYAALNAVRQVLKEHSQTVKKIIYVCHDACYNGAQLLSLNIIEQLRNVFHYEVYVVLINGGVLLDKFKQISSDVLCLGKCGDAEEALINWISRNNCQKALCNTVVSGDILKVLCQQGVRCVSMIHEMENVVKQYHCENKLKNITEYADKIVFASDYVRKSVESICCIPEEKVVIAPQGLYKVNPYGSNNPENRSEIRKKYKLSSDSKIALGVGFGDYRKGVDLFTNVAIEVCNRDENAAFIWLGEVEPHDKNKIDQLLASYEFANRIIFAGPSDDVFTFYSASDLFILTSREDPFPTVVMEAMNASLPVVAFKDGGGYVENISDKTGVLVEMENWQAMAQRIFELFQDEEERHFLGANAYRYVTSNFSFIGYIFKLLDLLGESYKKITAVVPNYNYSRYLKQRIDSIIQQDYPIFEIILLDDKSKDNSLEIMHQYEQQAPLQVKVYPNDENSGNVFNQWEKGCNLAKGDYIWIAEADDLSKDNFVSSIISEMQQDNDIVLGYSQSYMMDEIGNVTAENYFCYTNDVDSEKWKNSYVSDAEEEIFKRMSSKNTIPNVSGVIFKKQDFSIMFKEAKKYNVAGDWAFYVKVMEQGGKVAFVADSLNYHRRHSNSVTTDLKAQIHFDEICKMQDYVLAKYPNEVNKDKVMSYRMKVKKDLGL